MRPVAQTIVRASLATIAAGAVVMASAAPALADDRRDRDRGGISAGEIIAGAVVLGGIAAVVAATRNNDRGYRDGYGRGGYDRGFDRGFDGPDNARLAIDRCVRTAERIAQRQTGARADVYEIRDVDRERRGFEVKGRIAVQDFRGRGYRGDYRRGFRNSGWDEGRFTCDFRNGRVTDVRFGGIRGLR